MTQNNDDYKKIIIQNRKARHLYHIEDVVEAGIVLKGSEVKSLRAGKANLIDSYASDKNNELYLYSLHINEYSKASHFQHEILRPRKLLLHRKQINKLIGKITTKGYTLIPLCIYFDKNNKVKVELALAIGKKLYDKRKTERDREWQRDKQQALKSKNQL